MIRMRGITTAGRSRTLQQIVTEHRTVFDRIKAGDASGASKAMQAHIDHTRALVIAQEQGRDGEKR